MGAGIAYMHRLEESRDRFRGSSEGAKGAVRKHLYTLAIIQISGTVISYCYDYRKSVRSAPRDLARMLDEVSDLRNVMERLIRLVDDDVASGGRYLPAVEQMTRRNGPLERCQAGEPIECMEGFRETLDVAFAREGCAEIP